MKKGQDPYLLGLGKVWPTILRAYHDFNERKPIIEYQLREKMIRAYPGLPYIRDLSASTRERTQRHYEDAIAAGRFMVFVCDRGKRIFRSYEFPVEEPEEGG